METASVITLLLSSLLTSSLALAAQDSSISGKNVEMEAGGSATAIIQTGEGRIIGKTGELIKELTPSKPSANYRNSSISANENLTIKATGRGTVIVQTGNGTIIYEANKEAVEQLGIAENSLASFFAVLQVEDVPIADWGTKLDEIAKSFHELKRTLAAIQTSDEEIIALKQQAEAAIDNGQFVQAKTLLDQAEQRAMDSYVENRLITAAEIAATKGALANTQLQYQAMGEAYEDAAKRMSILEEEKHHAKWSEHLNWAGLGFQKAGQYKRAEPFYEEALSLRKKYLSDNHADIVTSLNNLAEIYRAQGDFSEAKPLLQEALSITENKLGKDHSSLGLMLNNMGLLYRDSGLYNKAEAFHQRALLISEKTLGADDTEVADSLNNMAELFRQQGRYEEAEPLLQRSLSIRKNKLPKNHPDIATTLDNLGLLYGNLGRYDEARDSYQQALTRLERKC